MTQPLPQRQERLLRRARRGDSLAFEELLREHLASGLEMALGICGDRQLAEDVVQEAALRAFRHLATYREEASFRSWWMRIVVHRASSARRALRPIEPLSHDSPEPLHVPTILERLQERELAEAFERALAHLPEGQRVALHLRVREGWSHREIAEVLETTEHAIRQRITTARQAIHRRLGPYLEDARKNP